MRQPGFIAVPDTLFLGPEREIQQELFGDVSEEIGGKGAVVLLFREPLQDTQQVHVAFGIGGAVDDLPVLDFLFLPELGRKELEHLLHGFHLDLRLGGLDFVKAVRQLHGRPVAFLHLPRVGNVQVFGSQVEQKLVLRGRFRAAHAETL